MTPHRGEGRARRARRGAQRAVLAVRAAVGRWVARRRPYNVLHIEIAGDLSEVETEWARWGAFAGRQRPVTLLGLLSILKSARDDADLGLVLLDVSRLDAGWSRIQSVRRALAALRASGKRVWAYLVQPGMREYYLATAADRVLLAPAALFDAVGLASEVVFVKGALDKLGIQAQLARAGRFKSAAETFLRTDMSAEHRAMVNAILDDLYGQIVEDVATARRLPPEAVRAAFEEGPLLAREAERRQLVDALVYRDQIDAELEDRFGDPAPIELARYERRRAVAARRAALAAKRVGLVAVSGAIGLGGGGMTGGRSAGWRGFQRELADFSRDPAIDAIILRIDSPGGSGLASDLMWREIREARLLKPVLVSMGDVAASGGYYLAVAADHVTAEPATLTGSIGVLAGKPVLRGLYDRLGISKELVVRGNASRHSDYVPLADADLARLGEEADAFYRDFVAKVAQGRSLPTAAVEAAAEGRVWTGREALARRLVDGLGGLEESVDETRRRLGLEPGTPVALERRPQHRPLWHRALRSAIPPPFAEGILAVLAPLARGEHLLASMPFLMATPAVDASNAGARLPDAARPMATRLVAAARVVLASLRRPRRVRTVL